MDPSGIITIIGLAVAIYAIIPRERRLDLSLRISKGDWIIILLGLVIVHYIIFFPILKELDLVFDIGSWRFGFNEKNTTYLIFLLLGLYVLFRAKTAKVKRSNIGAVSDLFEELLLDKKYGELALLVEQHIIKISELKNSYSFRNYIADKVRPISDFEFCLSDVKRSWVDKYFSSQLNWISSVIEKEDVVPETASSILRRLINNPEFVRYLSISRPYLGIDILDLDTGYTKDFLKNFLYSLIDDEGSIFYYELDDTQSMISYNRYHLSRSNKLIFYLLSDVSIGEKLAVYKPIGDRVCEFIDYDDRIIARYNEPLGTYCERQQSRCPIDSSVHFFDIMIIESMHQGVRWHMWLYYLSTFVRKIINKLNPTSDVDLSDEWPTPFHYILYHIVRVMLGWLGEYSQVEDKSALQMKNEHLCHDNGSIPKSTVLALGNIVVMLVSSPALTDHFKKYILEIIIRHLVDHDHDSDQAALNRILMISILKNGYHNKIDRYYIEKFSDLYSDVDEVLRYDVDSFNELLKSIKLECASI